MRFLCLHGRATCAQIFEMQTASIREDLQEHEFFFINGSVLVQPDRDAIAGSHGDRLGYLDNLDDIDQLQELLEGLRNVAESQGPFDGIMGFSEGAAIAAMLLAEDARRPFAGFKCGVLFSAAPPLDPGSLRAGSVRCLDPAQDGVVVHVPTAHIYSHQEGPNASGTGGDRAQSPLDKLWSASGWLTPEQGHGAVAQLCDSAQVFVHGQGHQVPGRRDPHALRGVLRAINRTIESVSVEI